MFYFIYHWFRQGLVAFMALNLLHIGIQLWTSDFSVPTSQEQGIHVPLCRVYVMLGIEPRTLCMAKAKQALYYLQPQSDSPFLWEHSCLAIFFLTHTSDVSCRCPLAALWVGLSTLMILELWSFSSQLDNSCPTANSYSSWRIHPLWTEILLVRDDGTKTGDPGQKDDIILHNRTRGENWEMSGNWTMGRYRNPTTWSSPFLGQIRLY